jgi:hypothetical protein
MDAGLRAGTARRTHILLTSNWIQNIDGCVFLANGLGNIKVNYHIINVNALI